MENKEYSKYINKNVSIIFKVAYFPCLSVKTKNDIRDNLSASMEDLDNRSEQYHMDDVHDIIKKNYKKDKTNLINDLKLIESLEEANIEYIEI